jgi:endo-1,4-beta-xylanase
MFNRKKIMGFIIGIFMFVGVSITSTAQVPGNLVVNGNFESGNTSGWTTQGAAVITAVTEQAIGTYSMKVTGRTSGWHAPTYNLLDKMEKGKTYSLSLKVRSVAGQAAAGHTNSVNVSLRRDADGATNYDTILWQKPITEDSWTVLTGQYTLSYTSTLTTLFIYVESSDATLEYYMDDVVILPPEPPAPASSNLVTNGNFENGSTSGWAVQGAAVITAVTEQAVGTYSMKVTGRTSGWHAPTYNLLGKMENGKKYAISLKARSVAGQVAAGHTNSLNVSIRRDADGATNYDTILWQKAITEDSWTELKGEYTLSYASTLTNLFIYIESSDATLQYYLDDVAIIPPDKPGFSFDFEDGTVQNWTKRGGEIIAAVTEEKHGGNYSLKTTGRTATWNGPAFDVTNLLTQGKTYHFALWLLYKDGAASQAFTLNMQKTVEGSSNSYTPVSSATLQKSQWTLLEGDYSVPVDSTMTGLLLYVETKYKADADITPNDIIDFYIDDISAVITTAQQIDYQKDIPDLHSVLDPYFPIGATVDPETLDSTNPFSGYVKKHYKSLVYGNAMKPDAIQPTEGNFVFSNADKIVDFTQANNMLLRGHTLLWHSQIKEWFFTDPADATKPATSQLLLSRMENHIKTLVGRYKGRVHSWDVVNEVVSANGDGLRGSDENSKWKGIVGDVDGDGYASDYIERAFLAAHEADPDALLVINDYGIETSGAKRDNMYNLVKRLLAKGIPIDGIGLQMHVSIYSPSVNEIRKTIELFASLGVKVLVTEMDLSIYSSSSEPKKTVTDDILLEQAQRYKQIFEMFKEEAAKGNLESVTLWGTDDQNTWLNNFPVSGRDDAPLLFDRKLQAKPAYWAIVDPGKLPVYRQKAYANQGTPATSSQPDKIWSTSRTVNAATFVKNTDGANAQIKMMWDASNLYLLVTVNDNTPNAKDGIEIFLDKNYGKTTSYQSDDRHYVISSDNSGSNDIIHIAKPIPGGYSVQAVIPIADASPVIGMKMGIDYTGSQDFDTSKFGDLALDRESKLTEAVFGTPVIDGAADGMWNRANTINTDVWVSGTSGSVARVKTMWDKNYIYVLADVTDSLLSKSSANAWEQDSVEIFIDQNDGKTAYYEEDDGQYRINFDNEKSFGGNCDQVNFRSATALTSTGYIVEAAIPLSAVKGAFGKIMGFDVQVNNDENADGTRDSVSIWCDPSGSSYNNTSLLGNVLLSDTDAPVLTWGAVVPESNRNGWNNTQVSVPYTATDECSGVLSQEPLSPLLFALEGAGQTGDVTVIDNANNSATFTSPVVNIDMSAPVIRQPENLIALQTDALSGVASVTVQLDGKVVSSPIVIAPLALGVGIHTIKVTATDFADNKAEKEFALTVTVDMEHLDDLIKLGYEKGFIHGKGIYNSLLAQVKIIQRHSNNKFRTLIGLKALRHFISTIYNRKIDKDFAALLLEDIAFIENSLKANSGKPCIMDLLCEVIVFKEMRDCVRDID